MARRATLPSSLTRSLPRPSTAPVVRGSRFFRAFLLRPGVLRWPLVAVLRANGTMPASVDAVEMSGLWHALAARKRHRDPHGSVAGQDAGPPDARVMAGGCRGQGRRNRPLPGVQRGIAALRASGRCLGNPRQLSLHGLPGTGNGASAGKSRARPGAGTLTRLAGRPCHGRDVGRAGSPTRRCSAHAFTPCRRQRMRLPNCGSWDQVGKHGWAISRSWISHDIWWLITRLRHRYERSLRPRTAAAHPSRRRARRQSSPRSSTPPHVCPCRNAARHAGPRPNVPP